MGLLKIRTLQNLEGASVFWTQFKQTNDMLIAIPDISWSVMVDIKETSSDVEEELVMHLFNLMNEEEAESLAKELTEKLFEKEIFDEYKG